MSTEKYKFKIKSHIKNLQKDKSSLEIYPIQNKISISRLRAYELIRSIEDLYNRHRTDNIKNIETVAAEAELYKAKINYYKRKLEEHKCRHQWLDAKRDINLIEQFSDKLYNLYIEHFNIKNFNNNNLEE